MNSDLLPFGATVHVESGTDEGTTCGRPLKVYGEDLIVDASEYDETVKDRDDLRCRTCEIIAF